MATCSTCSKSFKTQKSLDTHAKKCVPKEVKPEFTSTSKITQETLPAFFECLHSLLWNQAGLSPERALEHMTFFFAYRLIECQADVLKLPQECRWSYISTLTNEVELFDTIKRGVGKFRNIPETKPFFRPHEIKKESIVLEIVQQINRITPDILQQSDTLGDIFEYMLGRGMSTMADEGQYFTTRAICKMAFELAYGIKKTLRRPDGSLCTFADWFCGTGGFPVEFIKGVNKHTTVDWKQDSESIYCQDMCTSSVTTTLLNMLINTGIPFSDTKIRSSNSFTESIIRNGPFEGLTVDYCFMNPPYGGDKTKGKDYKFAYSKKVKGENGKTEIQPCVNADIQTIGIHDDDKVSAGVQLAMATLSEGGVCCIVLPQGFFFGISKKGVELRKKLAEEYKITHVVDIASGTFKNTGTKTSMMVFQKGVGPTIQIEFISLKIQDKGAYDQTVLITCTLEELRAKNYSLNYKQYIPQTIVAVEGFEMVKLGDVCMIESGTYITKNTSTEGEFPVYGGGGVSNYISEFNRESLFVIAKDGVSEECVRYVKGKFFLNHHGWTFKCKDNADYMYVGYWLLNNQSKLYSLSTGTSQKGINQTSFYDIQIPLPSLERQKQIVEAIDGWSDLVHQEESSLQRLEKQVMFQVKEMGRGQPLVKLGDVCEIKYGDKNKTYETDELYPGIGGGVAPSSFVNNWNIEAYIPIVSRSGSAGYISRYSTKVSAGSFAFVCIPNDKIIIDHLYFVLKNEETYIMTLPEGTVQKNMNRDVLRGIQIPLPPLEDQQTLQPEFEEIRHKHEKIARYKAKAQEAIQRLIPA